MGQGKGDVFEKFIFFGFTGLVGEMISRHGEEEDLDREWSI